MTSSPINSVRWRPLMLASMVCCCLALTLVSCSRSGGALIGRWKSSTNDVSVEFHADGTAILGEDGDLTPANFAVLSGDTLRFSMSEPGNTNHESLVIKFVVHGDALDLTSPQGEIEHLERVK